MIENMTKIDELLSEFEAYWRTLSDTAKKELKPFAWFNMWIEHKGLTWADVSNKFNAGHRLQGKFVEGIKARLNALK